MSHKQRLVEIEQHINANSASILEIGALDNPTFRRPAYHIKYLDYASTDQLVTKAESNPRYAKDKLVQVDFVCPGTNYSKYVKEKFDLIIANHVIEHIPDVIRWLKEIEKLLNPGGILFLSIPDKRYTFDIMRTPTDFIDLLRNYRENVTRPDFYHILSHFYYHKSVTASDVWNGAHVEKMNCMRFDPKSAVAVAEKFSSETYADVHCHIFTPESFRGICGVLRDLDLLSVQQKSISNTIKFSNEFYSVFFKPT